MQDRPFQHATRVDVCIITLRRPESLRTTLESIGSQSSGGCRIRVLVVDNDAQESARGVVEPLRPAFPFELAYCVAPERGISNARNKAVEEATGADWIAFIDDDMTLGEGWLPSFAHAATTTNADILFGPVIGKLAPGAPAWTLDHPVYRPARLALTRSAGRIGGTGNIWIRRASIRGDDEPFRREFNGTGGEDTEFVLRQLGHGSRAAWCMDAQAYENYPLDRLTVSWMFRRSLRSGQGWSRVVHASAAVPKRSALMVVRLGLAGLMGLAALIAFPFSRERALSLLHKAATNLGQATGLLGKHMLFREYSPKRYRSG